jgi:hypothetical protein
MRHLPGSITAAAILTAALVVPAAPVLAQERADSELIVYGNDPCPADRSSSGTIVVCKRLPEAQRYRIPPKYRPSGTRQQMDSWANRAKALQYVGNTGPMSCSSVGPGGYTGCLSQEIARAKAEAAESQSEDTPPPK